MFPKNTRLIFSFRKIGNGPGTIKFGILSFGIHFMKFSTLKDRRRPQRCSSRLFHCWEYSVQSSGQSTLPEDHQYDQNQRKTSCNKPQKCSSSIDYAGVTSQRRFEGRISCKFILLQLSAGWLDKSYQQFLYGYVPCSLQIQFLRLPYSLLCTTKFMLIISNHSLQSKSKL